MSKTREVYKTLCFTGHRKIGATYGAPQEAALLTHLTGTVERAYDKGYRCFVSGGAIGTDQLAARAVIKLKQEKNDLYLPYPDDVHLVIAKPFPNQSSKWPVHVREHFDWLCARADRVFAVSQGGYSADKMMVRNRSMVDVSDTVIAVWNGVQQGGTWNCIEYALSVGKCVLIVDSTSFIERWVKQKNNPGGQHEQAVSNTNG